MLVAIQFLHALAQGVTVVALPWMILEAGGSVTGAGLVLTATFLPFAALGLPAGLAGDRLSRRAVFACALGVQTLAGVVLIAVAGMDVTSGMTVLLGAALVMGCGRVFVDAAMFGSLGALVPPGGMLSAQAAVASAFNLGYYGGPAAGAVMIGTLGLQAAFVTMVAATATAALLTLLLGGGVEARHDVGAHRDDGWSSGLRLLFTEPTMRALAIVAFLWSLLASGLITLAVPRMRLEMGLDGAGVGIVMAAGVGTMMAAPVLLHRLGRRVRDTRILVVALGAYLAPVTVFATAGGVLSAALAYGPMMLATAVCAATFMGARARRTPARLQALAGVSGRMLVITGFTVGSALAGVAADATSAGTVYVAIGFGMAALAVGATLGLDRPVAAASRRAHASEQVASGRA